MRLTKKDLDMLDTASVYSKAQHKVICEQAIKECYEYKCIEDELGIDLITLSKALKEGFFDRFGEYHHFSNLYFNDEEIFDGYTRHSYAIRDYGKTWALTEEELE